MLCAIEASDVALTAAIVVLGLGSGILAGMLGVGGAVITTPGVRALGATPIHAVGSTVPAILPGALSGTWRYHRAGMVDWRVGLTCGLTGSVLAVAGAWIADLVEARWLMVATAGLMLWSGWSVERSGRRSAAQDPIDQDPIDQDPIDGDPIDQDPIDGDPIASAAAAAVDGTATAPGRDGPVDATATQRPGAGGAEPSTALLAGVGAVSGFVAGLLGVGGGIIMLPTFTSVLGLPVKRAVAASLVAVAIFSVPALVTHTVLGHVDWSYALPLAVGVVPGAQIGSRITIGTSEALVRRAFGVLLAVTALIYGGTELAGL